MQKRILPLAITAIIFISLIGWNCTKLDTTDLGGDQLPAVDNVNTFDTTLFITTSQGYFNDITTSVGPAEDHALGYISNDPIFGRTTANIFMQVKPSFYPYYFGNAGDTLVALDSVVLCLKYTGFWGDSSQKIELKVKEINDAQFRDSFAKIDPIAYQPVVGAEIGSALVDVTKLRDTIRYTNGKNSSVNIVRIKLSQSWANQLFGRDSSVNNAFYNDSIYKRFYNGLAVVSNQVGNGLMYVNLGDTATKLEIHYRKRKSGVLDTTYAAFRVNLGSIAILPSNTVNYISRDRSGFPAATANSNVHYLQTAPGTFVNINVPGLATFPNSIIHRAEFIVEQVPDNISTDSMFSAPNFLYLDLKDTGVNKYKPVYFDLNSGLSYDPDNLRAYFLPTGGQIDFSYFGGYKRRKTDATVSFNFYTFNISRHIQQQVTRHTPNYSFRLYAPFNLSYPQYTKELVAFTNNIAFGRVRVGSATNTGHPMKLRIIYSKL